MIEGQFSDSVVSATQFGQPNTLSDIMMKGGVFMESKMNPSLLIHGKYTHLLQLVLICRAAEQGWVTLPCKPITLAYLLASTQPSILNKAGKTTAWDEVLENNNSFFNNAMMMHPGMDIPTLRTYWSASIYKWYWKTYNFHLKLNRSYTEKSLMYLIGSVASHIPLTMKPSPKLLIRDWRYHAKAVRGEDPLNPAVWRKKTSDAFNAIASRIYNNIKRK